MARDPNHWIHGRPQVATEEDVKACWSGGKDGKYFRCYLCGYKFKVGDYWRWQMAQRFGNFLTCENCDGPDVMLKWYAAQEELNQRFWWALREIRQ